MKTGDRILAINAGSSSLKFGLYETKADGLHVVAKGEAQDIGAAAGHSAAAGHKATFSIQDATGASLLPSDGRFAEGFADIGAAAEAVFEQLQPRFEPLLAIAHRIVHGGPEIVEHQRLTPAVRSRLEAAKDFAPLHVPPALAIVDAAAERFPTVPQIVCLDTAFHRTLPERARRFALPDDVVTGGVCRYGAHGLSLESAVRRLGPQLRARCVIAHLGGGCSVTAVQDGHSIDTTMGLTPTGGMMMGTRTGDLDPGVLIYLLRHRGFSADTLEALVDRRSGLLGVSGSTSDLRSLTERAGSGDAHARLALEMFAYEAAQAIAKMTVALGGLDQLVFTGGIGEHAAAMRVSISAAVGFLGVVLDGAANTANVVHPGVISVASAGVEVCIVPAEEEQRMAQIAVELSA